jgi:hypothetical protein
MASAGTARAGDAGADGGSGGGGAGGAGGSGGSDLTGIQPTTTSDNLGCSTGRAAGGERAPIGIVGLLLASAALARGRRSKKEGRVR